MAQDKDEAAIPDETAPEEPTRIASSSESETDRSPGSEPSESTDAQIAPPATQLGDLMDTDSAPTPVESGDGNDTESPEPAPAASESGTAESEAAPPDAKPVRRILSVRSASTPPALSSLGARAPWTHLRKLTAAVVASWALVFAGFISAYLLGSSHLVSNGIFALALVVASIFPGIELVQQARRFTVPVVMLLVVAAFGAIIIGHWRDAALLLSCYLTLVAVRELIVRKSAEPLQALATARVSQARPAGGDRFVPIKEVTAGDTIRIDTNEIVPLDGFVERGTTTVDESIVTGSSDPVEKQRGSDLYAGSRNLGDSIEMRVARRPSQRTIVRVAKAARTATNRPSRAQQMLDDIAGVYALAMLAAAVLALLVLVLLGDHAWRNALERVVAFLIAASPAALLLSAAVAYRAAMANAIRNGVLFRGQDELEILGTVRTIAFDKTGTLTRGKPVVTGVVNCATGWTDDEILSRAASAELRSGHRLGGAIVDAARGGGLDIPDPASHTPSPGKGIVATVDGRTVAVGNANLFAELGVNTWRATEISADLRDEGRSAVLVGDKENVRGVIGVSDPLRPEAPAIVADLASLHIRRTAMLTGDDETVARVIADEAGLREVYADLLPEEKLGVVRQMEQGAPVGMVAGAGENSPTLSIATSGIALGSVAADVTREPAGVLLFGGELAELPFAIWIAQTARRTTTVGLLLLIGVMAVLATGALVVGIPPVAVILVWSGVALVVLLAGLRLLWATRRLPRRRVVPALPADGEISPVTIELPRPRYVIDDDDEDDDDDL